MGKRIPEEGKALLPQGFQVRSQPVQFIETGLASLLVAREWERGTFEALFVSPVQPLEIVLSKAVPYVAIGLADVAVVLGFAVFVFDVPIRGSLAVLAGVSLEFLIVSVLMGLVISALARTQFLASQVALLVSFMPAVVLSGFIFDLRSMPHWIQPICSLLPATHFMKAIKTVFLVGNEASIVGFEAAVLLGYDSNRLFLRIPLKQFLSCGCTNFNTHRHHSVK